MAHKFTEAPPVKGYNEFITIPTEEFGKSAEGYGASAFTVFFYKYGGMLMALASSLFFSISFLIIKILGSNYGFQPFGSAVLFHVGVVVPAILAIIFHQCGPGGKARENIFQEIWPLTRSDRRRTFFLLLTQASLQAAAVIFRSYALKYLAIGDMTVIVFSSPVVTTVIAYFMIGEPIGLFFIFTAIFTLTGVGLVVKPPIFTGNESFDDNTMIGSCLAAGALLSLSFTFVVTRKLKNAHYLLKVLFLGTFGLIVTLILYVVFEEPHSILPKDVFEFLLVASLLTAFGALVTINIALTLEDAGPIALVRSCDVIFAFVLQFVFLNVVPDLLSAIGASIVVCGVLMTGFRKWLFTLPDDAKQRKHFSFCLK